MSEVSKIDSVKLMSVLSKIPLFKDLLPEEREIIQKKIRKVESYSKG